MPAEMFLCFAHSKCNIKRRTVNCIPIFGHNLSFYDFDLHFICQNLHLFSEESKFQVIPLTDEKYIWLSLCIKAGFYTDRQGVERHVNESCRLNESHGFTAPSMDKHVGYLHADN